MYEHVVEQKCVLCGSSTPVVLKSAAAALNEAPYPVTDRDLKAMSFFHLDCAISDGIWLKEGAVTG